MALLHARLVERPFIGTMVAMFNDFFRIPAGGPPEVNELVHVRKGGGTWPCFVDVSQLLI